jgi:hypothetical protein
VPNAKFAEKYAGLDSEKLTSFVQKKCTKPGQQQSDKDYFHVGLRLARRMRLDLSEAAKKWFTLAAECGPV